MQILMNALKIVVWVHASKFVTIPLAHSTAVVTVVSCLVVTKKIVTVSTDSNAFTSLKLRI